MVKFSAAEDDPSSEVENFLEAVKVFFVSHFLIPLDSTEQAILPVLSRSS